MECGILSCWFSLDLVYNSEFIVSSSRFTELKFRAVWWFVVHKATFNIRPLVDRSKKADRWFKPS